MTQPNIFISCKESRIENNKSFYGCFYLGPFDSGQSLTVANALRRTLLSECPGLGIVSVTIDNVKHEYSTIPGVRESVLDLLLNLKEVVLRKTKRNYALYKKNSSIYNQIGVSYFKPVSGFLKVKGPGVIRAKDLKLPPFVECVDPEQYIATLAEDGFLCMKFIIMEGKGYLLPQLMQARFGGAASTKSESSNFTLGTSSAQLSYPGGDQKQGQMAKKGDEDKGFDFDGDKQSPYSLETTKYVKKRLNFIQEIQNLRKQSGFSSNSNREGKKNQDESKMTGFDTYLNLDTVFNPITKVSYIIEDFDNKIMDDANQKVNFVDDVCSLIESSQYLKENFPSLNKHFSMQLSPKEQKHPLQRSEQENNSIKTRENFLNFLDTYSTSEIQNLSYYLQPLKKHNPKQNIILEIWTNGSLHPRDALYMAFEKLSSLFLNIKKTQTYDSVYVNESSLLIAGLNLAQNPLLKDSSLSSKGEKQQDTKVLSERVANQNLFASQQQLRSGKQSQANDLTQPIESLNLSLRPYTLLKRANIHTLGDLSQLTTDEIQSICGFNHKYVTHILNSIP